MAYEWQRWMPDAFRAAGLEVIEVDGWENRGRPASTGNYVPDQGVTNHHTASTTSTANPAPTIGLLVAGRPDLPGPLAPWSVDYLGRVWIIAAGRCNHAGAVGKPLPGTYIGADGNAIFMGDEIDTNGTQTMPPAQRDAVAITNAIYLQVKQQGLERLHRHEDISATGKWDLGSLTTQQLRDDAAAATTTPEDIDIMDADTKAWLSQRFTTIRKGQAQIAAGTADLLEVVADIEGLTKDNRTRVEAAKRKILTAIKDLDQDDAQPPADVTP